MESEISTRATMEVLFGAEERCLRHVRLSIVSFIMVMTENRELASRVAMAAAELVENAVKYSTGPKVVFQLHAQLEDRRATVRLETENSAAPEKIATVQRIIAEVGEGDGMEAYLRCMREIPSKSVSTSQLGLARIRFEGQMSLEAKIIEDRVRLIATTSPISSLSEVA